MARRRGISDEDAVLWAQVAQSAMPMHRVRPVLPPKPPPPPEPPEPAHPPLLPPALPPFRVGALATPGRPHNLVAPLVERLRNAPAQMDRRAFERMTRGKLGPEARIDLHGMTLAQAHPALVRFILSAQGRGLRLVLVITGKGKARADEGPIPLRAGALRHQVPHWLGQAPLGPSILQIAPAHLRHGGGGAYYVYLRRVR